jgi:hypothetical protein
MPNYHNLVYELTGICKEETCKREFYNNSRNSRRKKEFCSVTCASRYWHSIKKFEVKE